MSVMNFEQKSCERIRGYLDSYVSNELLIETNHEVLRHLERCKVCAEALAVRVRVKNLLQNAVQREAAPDVLWEAIQRTIQEHESKGRFTTGWRRWGLAAAVVILVALGGWGTFRWWKGRDASLVPSQAGSPQLLAKQVEAILAIGLGDHIYCALQHHLAEERFTVEEMSQAVGPEYAGLIPVVKEKVPQGYQVVVAHRCVFRGRTFVHLIVRHQETVLSVVVTKKQGESFPRDGRAASLKASGVSLYRANLQGLEVAGFETQGCLAFVVSNLAKDRNLSIASSLAPPVRSMLDRVEHLG